MLPCLSARRRNVLDDGTSSVHHCPRAHSAETCTGRQTSTALKHTRPQGQQTIFILHSLATIADGALCWFSSCLCIKVKVWCLCLSRIPHTDLYSLGQKEGGRRKEGRLIWNSCHAAPSLFSRDGRADYARCSAAPIKRWDWAENAFPLLFPV